MAKEIENFQSIGVQCREILIELGNNIYYPEMAKLEEQPQESNFKKKAELFIKYYFTGSDNSDYRSYIKKLIIVNDDSDKDGIVSKLHLKCEECNEITAVSLKD